MNQWRRNCALAWVLLCVACGGNSADDASVSSPGGGRGGADAAGGSSASAAVAGAETSEPSDAGARGYVSLIESATRRCADDRYCFGLECYAPLGLTSTVCVAPCDSDLDCHRDETCVRAAKLEATCYTRCDSPSDCYDGFDCLDFDGMGRAVCFPASWAIRRRDLGD